MHFFSNYLNSLFESCGTTNLKSIDTLVDQLVNAATTNQTVFICGNGGSSANANHISNDLHYGFLKMSGQRIRVISLSANQALISCLANDTGYENIFSSQLDSLSCPGDLLIALSGSGNSPNILKALRLCQQNGVRTTSIVAFDGGLAKKESENCVHLKIDDMQIAEDFQLILMHSAIRQAARIIAKT